MENFSVKPLRDDSAEIGDVRKMMCDLFPEEERSTVEDLLQLARGPGAEFSVYFLDGVSCAFSFIICRYGILFVYYLAVKEEYQSRGLGKRILDDVKGRHPTAVVVLNVERPGEVVPNCDQRVRRMRFYRNNGLHSTPYILLHDGVQYRVLTSDNPLDTVGYKRLLEEISDLYRTSSLYVLPETETGECPAEKHTIQTQCSPLVRP